MTKCRDVTVGYVTKPECDEVSSRLLSRVCHCQCSGRWKDAHWRESWWRSTHQRPLATRSPESSARQEDVGLETWGKPFMKWEMNFWFSGYGWVPRQGEDNRGRQPIGDLRDRAPENLQARDQACAQARRCGGVCRRAQGGHFHFSICQLSCVPQDVFHFHFSICELPHLLKKVFTLSLFSLSGVLQVKEQP